MPKFSGKLVGFVASPLLLLTAMTGFVATAGAADLEIRNARLFDATDTGFTDGVTIRITGNRIESIARDSSPSQAPVTIDAHGSTVMPGLIDAHVHLFFDLDGDPYFPSSDAEAIEYIERRMPEKLRTHLEQGFTSVFSAIDFWPEIATVARRVDSGEFPAPRLFFAGGVLVAPGGHYICRRLEAERKQWCDEHISGPVGDAAEVRAVINQYAASGAHAIVYDSVTNATAVETALVASIVEAAHDHGLPLLVHTSDANGFGQLLEAGVDGFVHPPSGSSPAADAAWAIAGSQHVPIGITTGETEQSIQDGTSTPEEIEAYQAVRHNLQALLQHGAMPVFATDTPGTPPAKAVPIAFRSLQNLGLSNVEVLIASTRSAARALGLLDEIGTLEVGKNADILIVRGDPEADLAAMADVEVVIKGGKVLIDRRQDR